MITPRQNIRQPAGSGNDLLISVIPLDAPGAIDIVADVVDLSDNGLGIVTHQPVDASGTYRVKSFFLIMSRPYAT